MIPGSNPNPFDKLCPDCGLDCDDCTCPDPLRQAGMEIWMTATNRRKARAIMPTDRPQVDDLQILAERFGSFDSDDITLMLDAMRGIGWTMPRVRQLVRALERALETAQWKESR